MLCIINNLARNPYKEEWPSRASSHQQAVMASSSSSPIFLLCKCHPKLPNKDIKLSSCHVALHPHGWHCLCGPLWRVHLRGECCAKKGSRAAAKPPAPRTPRAPRLMSPKLCIMSSAHHCLQPTKVIKKYLKGILAQALSIQLYYTLMSCHNVDMIKNCFVIVTDEDEVGRVMIWIGLPVMMGGRVKGFVASLPSAKYSTQLPPLTVVPHTLAALPTIPTKHCATRNS